MLSSSPGGIRLLLLTISLEESVGHVMQFAVIYGDQACSQRPRI